MEWRKQGLNPPKEVTDATKEYQKDEDIIGHFFDDRCLLNPENHVRAGDIYKEYEEWCKNNGHKPMSGTRFGVRMKERFKRERKGSSIVYYGIGLREKDYESM